MKSELKLLPDLTQLQNWDAFDARTRELLESCLLKNQRVLIFTTGNAGKNTFQNAIVNFYHRGQYNPLVVPPVDNVPYKSFKTNPEIKKILKTIKGHKSYVAAFDYKADAVAKVEPIYNYFKKHFDCILEIHNDGTRRLYKITEKGKTVYERPVHRYPNAA